MDTTDSPANASLLEEVSLFKKRAANSTTKRKRNKPSARAEDSREHGETLLAEDSERSNEFSTTKKRRTFGLPVAGLATASLAVDELPTTRFTADRNELIKDRSDATKHVDWFEPGLEQTPDHGRRSDIGTSLTAKDSYKSIMKAESASNISAERSIGPRKSSSNVRIVTMTDFAPDVCKDYKQTGFCGFGDSCKFLHAREDYKQGWQLARDWDIHTKQATGTRNGTTVQAADSSRSRLTMSSKSSSEIPFACVICKSAYRSPVVTQCDHYFCERCALGRYRKEPTCAVCGASTRGVFNAARGLQHMLKQQSKSKPNDNKSLDLVI